MRLIVRLLTLVVFATLAAKAQTTFTVTQVAYVDCQATSVYDPCSMKISDGDTFYPTGWSDVDHPIYGPFVSEAGTVGGRQFATLNDYNPHYAGDDIRDLMGPNCSGRSMGLFELISPLTNSGGSFIRQVNCLFSFGLSGGGDETWSPASSGTCASGHVDHCDWKTLGLWTDKVSGVTTIYLQVYRQGRGAGVGTVHPFRGYDSTVIMSQDDGLTWKNPYTVAHAGSADADGDAPAGPGHASYPGSILWPDSGFTGLSQHMARLQPVLYGKAGATLPSTHGAATYQKFVSYDGEFTQLYLSRVERATQATLDITKWSYFSCPSGTCSEDDPTKWSSSVSGQNPIQSNLGLGSLIWSEDLGEYLYFASSSGDTVVHVQHTDDLGHGFTDVTGTMSNSPFSGATLGFIAVIPSSLKVITPGSKIQLTVAGTAYNHSGAGSPAYVTYEITKTVSGGGGGGMFPMPMPVGSHGAAEGGELSLSVSGVSNTQAVLTYTAPSGSACIVEVSEDSGYTTPVNDVNTSLFEDSNLDSRDTSVNNGTSRMVVIGARRFDRDGDDAWKYRSLQANTLHYVRVTCGATTDTTTFTTGNIPVGSTLGEPPIPDSANPGEWALPSIADLITMDRTTVIHDPQTGVHLSPVSIDGDKPGGMSGSWGTTLASGGFSRACGKTLHSDGAGKSGYICNLDGTAGGYNAFYITTDGEVRNLGIVPGSTGPGSKLDDDLYIYSTNGDGLRYPYTNTSFTAVASGGYITELGSPETYSSTTVSALMHNFDASFDTALFPNCGAVWAPAGGYAVTQCRRSSQNSYGYYGLFYAGDGRVIPSSCSMGDTECPRIVAVWDTFHNKTTRYCALHAYATTPRSPSTPNLPVLSVNFHGLNIRDDTHTIVTDIGLAAVATTTVGTATAGTNTITVSGPLAFLSTGDTVTIPPASAGDRITFDDIGGGYTITNVTGSVWTLNRNLDYTVNPDTIVNMACNTPPGSDGDWSIVYADLLNNPNGDDETGTYIVPDTHFPGGGHYDTGNAGRISETTGGEGAFPMTGGDIMASLNQDPILIDATTCFAGVCPPFYGVLSAKHPSYHQSAGTWFLDRLGFVGDAGDRYYSAYPTGASVVSTGSGGVLYQYHPPTAFPTLHRKQLPTQATTGGKSLRDISGPGSVLGDTAAYNYQYCTALVDDECVTGSAEGDIYFNVPEALDYAFCTGGNGPTPWNIDACIIDMPGYSGAVMQFVPDTDSATSQSKSRNLTNGLVGPKNVLGYPLAKATYGSEFTLFTVGWNVGSNPAGGTVTTWKIKQPPLPEPDDVDRSTFIPALVDINTPTGLSIDKAVVEYGFLEEGVATDYYCSSRREKCWAVASTITEATPFYYPTETPTKLSCVTSCTIAIPNLPGRIVYYRVAFYNGSTFVQYGNKGVAIEGNVYEN